MSFFGSIATGFKMIFSGSPKTADDIFDKDKGLLTQAGNWIGNMHFTEQEKAESRAQIMLGATEFIKATLSESTERSQTRRRIAMFWIRAELALVAITVLAYPFWQDYSAFVWQVATSDMMLWGTLSVLAFFFGPYMIGQHINRTGQGK